MPRPQVGNILTYISSSSAQKHTPMDLFHHCGLDCQGPLGSCSLQRNPKMWGLK